MEDNISSIWDVTPWSPYLVIVPDNAQEKLSSLSVFKIQKALQTIGAGNPKAVDRLGSGGLLVQVLDRVKSCQLLTAKTFAGIAVSVRPHNSLNTSRGVVKSRDLDGCTAEELVEELESVTHARRMMRRENGVLKNTNSWVLTFSSPKPPSKLRVAYLELEVRPYVPNPLRCFKCHRFGHGAKNCSKVDPVCARCGQGGHEEAGCKATPRCLNCRGDHSASSRDCPKWQEEKTILEYRARHGGTFKQVRDCLFPKGLRQNQTYAKVLAQGTAAETTAEPETRRSTQSKKKGKGSTKPSPQVVHPAPVKTKNKFSALSVEGEEEMEAQAIPSLMSLSPSSTPLPPSSHSPSPSPGKAPSVGASATARAASRGRTSDKVSERPQPAGKAVPSSGSRRSSQSPGKGARSHSKHGGLKPGVKPTIPPKK